MSHQVGNTFGPEGKLTGTYTPTLTGSSVEGTVTLYSTPTAYNKIHYTRIGDLVYIHGLLKVNAVTVQPEGLLKISLPYTIATGAEYCTAINVVALGMDASVATSVVAYAEEAEKFMYVFRFVTGSSATDFAEYINVDTVFRISGSYVAGSYFG